MNETFDAKEISYGLRDFQILCQPKVKKTMGATYELYYSV